MAKADGTNRKMHLPAPHARLSLTNSAWQQRKEHNPEQERNSSSMSNQHCIATHESCRAAATCFPNDSQAMSLPRLSSSHIRSMTAKNHPKQPASFHIESTAGCERIKLETYLTITLQLTNEYAARMLQLSVQQARKNLLNCQMSDSTDHYNP